MKVYSFVERATPPRVIDIMVKPMKDFDQAYSRRVTMRANDISVPLMPIDVLVRMKQEAGRPEDLLDLAALKALGKIPET